MIVLQVNNVYYLKKMPFAKVLGMKRKKTIIARVSSLQNRNDRSTVVHFLTHSMGKLTHKWLTHENCKFKK